MKITKKKAIFALCILIVVSVISVFLFIRHREAVEVMEQRLAYAHLNRAFGLVIVPFNINDEYYLEQIGIYMPLSEADLGKNRFGIVVNTYLLLKLYERETGNEIPYEMVVDYFSQEFEPDGSLRLHNNGKHPEINAFVEWMWGIEWTWGRSMHGFDEFNRFLVVLQSVYSIYYLSNRENGFVRYPFNELSPQMLDALVYAKGDATSFSNLDPVIDALNLTELQQQGY